MSSSADDRDRRSLLELTGLPDYAMRACSAIDQFKGAMNAADAIVCLRRAVESLGGEVATFTSFQRDDPTLESYRSLLVCNPSWGTEYARHEWFVDDPWLQYARRSTEPAQAADIHLCTDQQRRMVEAAEQYGFRSSVVVPAPSTSGHARLAVLCIGSSNQGFFQGPGYGPFRVLARSLAMEVHEWWQRQLRAELMASARISASDLDLLRREEAGECSKVIAAALNTQAKTIDVRFQRVSSRLGAANRRAAVRLAKIYGLL